MCDFSCLAWLIWITLTDFSHIEPALHFWTKTHLVMVYNYFYTLLNFFLYIVQYTNIFWRILAPMYMRDVGLQFSPLVMSLSSFETRAMLASPGK